jgi:flagellum-specific ATP synthase
MRVTGKVAGITGLTIEATDLPVPVGSLCRIHSFGGKTCMAEVIGVRKEHTLLMPLSPIAGVSRGDRVENVASAPRITCSDELLGRVIDGFGKPIDGKGPLHVCETRRIDARSVAPLTRQNIHEPIATSVRAIDGLHTCGLGQRMGIFAGPGVGKSTLMSSIAKNTSADISVVALIGERGREVQEFLSKSLGPEGMAKVVLVVSTGDDPPPLRVRAAKVATTIAEYFRDQGKDVMLMMDSVTRFAMAQREVGLAIGEPPATRGYTPSVFALLPRLLERAGTSPRGSITGLYTVLVDGDDMNEPIADAVRSILDGHVVLTRALAHTGHYPAIDVLQSVSRLIGELVPPEVRGAGRRVSSAMAAYREKEDLISIGAYQHGSDPLLDAAITLRPRINAFLRQRVNDFTSAPDADAQLLALAADLDAHSGNFADVQLGGLPGGAAQPAPNVPVGTPGGALPAIPSLALSR